MSELIVIGFDDEHKAFELRAELAKMQKEYLIEMEDVVVVTKNENGNAKLHQAVNLTAAGAVGGGFWGMLIGMIFPFSPIGQFETASLFFVTALNTARERIWLSAPCFAPDAAVVKALQFTTLRGVDVRIITTGKPDSWPVYLAAFHYVEKLAGLGIKFYAYKSGFLQEKVMLVDNKLSTVGTQNFDNRSLRLNFEVTAAIVDEKFAGETEAMFEADFAHAEPIDPENLKDQPLWWWIGVKLSRLAAPVH